MKTINNTILDTDSYKYSQFNQYPPQTEGVFSYISARGPSAHSTSSVFFGLQAFLMEGFSEPIRMEHVDEAEEIVRAHGLPFYRGGWEQIVKKHGGYLPVSIRAVPEGSVVPVGNALLTIENTTPQAYWLTSFLETALLRAIWYPTTVATNSYEIKKLILSYLIRTGDPNLVDFKLHDFGSRGVSSRESAMLGAMAHLVNFKGTDTVAGLIGAREYYQEPMAGFSIPAMEHSTVTSWGRDAELDSFRNMMDLYAKEGALLACVSDSYDIFAAARAWATELREQVVKSDATVVIRPDSGDPVKVVLEVAKILAEGFGTTTNSKGFRVLKHVRIIQGDGVSYDIIDRVLSVLEANGFSADNVAFGQGGGAVTKCYKGRFEIRHEVQLGECWWGVEGRL